MTHQIWAWQNYKDYLIETIQQMLQRGLEMTRTWRFKIFQLYHWCSLSAGNFVFYLVFFLIAIFYGYEWQKLKAHS